MIQLSNYKDVSDQSLPYIIKFNQLMDENKYNEAESYLKQNYSMLKNVIINAESFNKIEREIHSTQEELYYKQRIVKSKTIPDSDTHQLANGSLWLKEY